MIGVLWFSHASVKLAWRFRAYAITHHSLPIHREANLALVFGARADEQVAGGAARVPEEDVVLFRQTAAELGRLVRRRLGESDLAEEQRDKRMFVAFFRLR